MHIATEVARGLAHAHAEGVIHRDLKPANVFVTNKGQVKILDFGMAHAFGRRRLSGGTPAYMAPEQWEDEPEDERTDVFALGVMLYRMLTGEYPFPEGQGRWSAEPATLRKLDVPGAPELAELVEKMLDRTPKGRPRDGAAVLAALTPIEDRLRAKPADGTPPVHAKRRKATFGDLLAELKRRHVFRVMMGYGDLRLRRPPGHRADHARRGPAELGAQGRARCAGPGLPGRGDPGLGLRPDGTGGEADAVVHGPGAPRFGRSRLLLPLAVAAAVLAIAAAGAGGWYAWKRAAEHRAAAAGTGASPSIAVLPFKDLSPNHDQEYFSDGMAEEILTALSKVKGLRVPGRASSFYFKGKDVEPGEIARKLGVAHLLEGSVRRSGNKLRISAEVVRASDGERIWSQTFDRDLTDVFAIQDEISRDVVEALRVKLMPGQPLRRRSTARPTRRPTRATSLARTSPRASRVTPQKRAIAALEKAVELDPGFAPPGRRSPRPGSSPAPLGHPLGEARREALVAANRAVELGPGPAGGDWLRAPSARLVEWDWPGARRTSIGPGTLARRPAAIRRWRAHALLDGAGLGAVDLCGGPSSKEPLDGAVVERPRHRPVGTGRFEEADRAFARARRWTPDDDGAGQPWEGARGRARPTGRGARLLPEAARSDRVACDARPCAYHALGNCRRRRRRSTMLARRMPRETGSTRSPGSTPSAGEPD